MATLPFVIGWGAQDWLMLIYSLRWFEFWQQMWCFAVAVSVCWLSIFLMPTASAQQYKSMIAFYCHSPPAQDCVCVSYRLVNLKTSSVNCQKSSGHISCSSLCSFSQEKRGIHLWLCGMAENQPASSCEGSAGAGDDVVGGLNVFPSVPFSVGLWQQAAGSQGNPMAQGIVFALLGAVALPEINPVLIPVLFPSPSLQSSGSSSHFHS